MDESPWADEAAVPVGTAPKPDEQEEPSSTSALKSSAAAATTSSRKPTRLTPRRLVAQPTQLTAVEDDPLGPLGAAAPAGADSGLPGADTPPIPPVKEQLPIRTTLPPSGAAPRRAGPADPHHIEDDDDSSFDRPTGPRQPPPVQAAQPSPVRSSTQPSVSVEQAAKPNFIITVGDPHKVGDLTSSHIVYSVRTRVCPSNCVRYLVPRMRVTDPLS